MKKFVVYDSVFDENHPTIQLFWEVVSEMSKEEHSLLLKFITSCPRPPLQGFGELNPPIAIRFAGQDETRLPTASTCVNLLKLPGYKSKIVLKEYDPFINDSRKLLYSIKSNSGFDLS